VITDNIHGFEPPLENLHFTLKKKSFRHAKDTG
jgi:hypothetical protein